MSEAVENETNDEEVPESPEVNQTNLFEVRDKELKAGGKRTWLHRLYLVASLDLQHEEPDDIERRASLVKTELDEFGAECEQQIKHLYNTYREEAATGFLLIYPKYMVHMLESSEDCLVAYLAALREARRQPRPTVTDARVLLVSHDIPRRLFDSWSYRGVVAPPREQVDSGLTAAKAATGLLSQLLRLAAHIRKTPQASVQSALELLSERTPELLPAGELMALALRHEATLDPDRFLDLYHTELAAADENEMVWPIPAHVFPYYN